MSIDFSVAPSIKAILILDSDGKRICAQYYTDDFAERKKQATFESNLFQKTSKTNARMDAQVVIFERFVTVYKFISDAYFYVLSGHDENELITLSVLTCLEETVTNLLRNQVDKRTLIENLDLVLLSIDEIVDDGIILETESSLVTNRVAMKGADKDVPLSEQSFSQALQTATQQIVKNFR